MKIYLVKMIRSGVLFRRKKTLRRREILALTTLNMAASASIPGQHGEEAMDSLIKSAVRIAVKCWKGLGRPGTKRNCQLANEVRKHRIGLSNRAASFLLVQAWAVVLYYILLSLLECTKKTVPGTLDGGVRWVGNEGDWIMHMYSQQYIYIYMQWFRV